VKVIKLNAIDSTNDYLKALSRKVDLDGDVVVVTHNQLHGRGQMGTYWFSEEGKNLSFSLLRRFQSLNVNHQFAINCAVSIAVKQGLELMGLDAIDIKWPNDILADNKKIGGILIENQLQASVITSSVIGVGINVNNEQFPDLPKATSMTLQMQKKYDLDEVLEVLVEQITSELDTLKALDFDQLKSRYERNLFRINTLSEFENSTGERFKAMIKGISENGELKLQMPDASLRFFKLKELQLIY